jgi:hypothetical protein
MERGAFFVPVVDEAAADLPASVLAEGLAADFRAADLAVAADGRAADLEADLRAGVMMAAGWQSA